MQETFFEGTHRKLLLALKTPILIVLTQKLFQLETWRLLQLIQQIMFYTRPKKMFEFVIISFYSVFNRTFIY